jgi:beta-glucosidase
VRAPRTLVLMGGLLLVACSNSPESVPATAPSSTPTIVTESTGAATTTAESPPATTASASDDVDLRYRDTTLPVADRVEILLGEMTLDEKFGQMTQIESQSLQPGDVARFHLGSVLHGGGSEAGRGDLAAWSESVARFQAEAVEDTRLGIPILYGVDAVHGFGGMYGATVFPHQIGLGAANDPDLMTRIGRATAEETASAGIRWTFSPVLAVPSDVRWGRTYESYSQDPAIVASLGAAYIEGLLGSDPTDPSSVQATAKHFIGDGATEFGTSQQNILDTPYLLDQGVTPVDQSLLTDVLVPPYQSAIDAGALTVMASYSSWGVEKVHSQGQLLDELLRGRLGFTGFVVSDWGGIDQIDPASYPESVIRAINAGIDMNMVPSDAERFLDVLRSAVDDGSIPLDRIDEAVRRIVTVKVAMGLFEHPYADPSMAAGVGSAEHRAVAREAVAKSAVLLKSDGAVPIPATARTITVVGNAADDMGLQAGGWTMSWQGSLGDVIPGTTLLDGIRDRAGDSVIVRGRLPASGSVDVCVVAVGEVPYAEGVGDSPDLVLDGLGTLDPLVKRCDRVVLVVMSGRPVLIGAALESVDTAVAAWLPGTAGEGIADVLFGDVPFTGTLPVDWPSEISQVPSRPGSQPLFSMGFGLAA